MSRWHERGCRFPDISLVSGIPCCNYCFALPSLDDDSAQSNDESVPSLPQLLSRSRMNLAWPSSVGYMVTEDGNVHHSPTMTDRGEAALAGDSDVHSARPSKPSSSQYEATISPALTSGDQIRLLRLKQSQTEDGPIHGDIELPSLSDTPPPVYDALSYTSADESGISGRISPIFIGPYWDVFYVTRNCKEALQSIRYRDADRLVWVDSVCVNQQNSNEKTHQAGLMRAIYLGAARAVAYLGASSPDSHLALGAFKGAGGARTQPAPLDPAAQIAVRSLFQRRYFSRLWTTQEVLLAQRLEFVSGQHSALWLSRPSIEAFTDTSAPSWLFDRGSVSTFGDRDLLNLLLNASPYNASDPRDKVLAILSLFYSDQGLIPDYSLPVETVYIGITAYLIKNCRSFDVLALAGVSQSKFNMPSWVPDWSKALVQRFPSTLKPSQSDLWVDDVNLACAEALNFDRFTDVGPVDPQVNASDGTLRIRATNLCDVSGKISWVKDRSKAAVTMTFGQRGGLTIVLLDVTYVPTGTDSVFLLSGWDTPVILRRHPDTDSYSFVSVCALYHTPPSFGTWLMPLRPWVADSLRYLPDITISRFSPEENEAILAFESRLMELAGATSPTTPVTTDRLDVARGKILDFGRLSLTSLRKIESSLKTRWTELDQKLGWMFLDQVAVWSLLRDISLAEERFQLGEGKIPLDEGEAAGFEQHCGVKFPSKYDWDLRRFCWSFIHPSTTGSEVLTGHWTPMLFALKEKVDEVQRWAELTEQLLQVFRYSQQILGGSWTSFPGAHLPNKWLSSWSKFCNTVTSSSSGTMETRIPLETDCFWDWTEFRDSLRAREEIWEETLPDLLDPSRNRNLAVHSGLKTFGFELYRQTVVNIV